MSDKKLFSEFPPVTTAQWENAITTDLKGADYEKKLVWRTNEGFSIRPYYRSENLSSLRYLGALPGEFPFVRGKRIKNNDWEIRQDFCVCDEKEANAAALEALSKGADSVGFHFHGPLKQVPDTAVLLKGINTEKVRVYFYVKNAPVSLLEALLAQGKAQKAVIFYDPLGSLARCGCYGKTNDFPLEDLKKLIDLAKSQSCLRVIGVNAGYFQNAGATAVQELAYGLSMGVEYLSQLTEAGCSVNDVAPRMIFQFAAGSNYFMEMAKIRAARMLWAHIVKAYNPSGDDICYMKIHAETALWNMTLYDPHVNILRSTTELMSAALGGADSISAKPFDAAYGASDSMAERIARNQQIVLKEEAYFNKISDPAAGSYYIENLTGSLAEHAWNLFLEIQDKGGYIQAMKEGLIQAKVEESAAKRLDAMAKRKEVLLGTNQYANFNEWIAPKITDKKCGKSGCCAADHVAKPIKSLRLGAAFEELRLVTERSAKRPKVFMLTIGNLAMRKARAGFACNFFAVAGFEVIDNNGFSSVSEGVAAALAANADIVVLCSSDEEYQALAPEAVKLLAGKAIFVLAGYPKALVDELKAAGIENFIFAGQNVLESLQGYQHLLGIA
ncbi:MAG: methylmalonyl-CoA mutase family protein [Bacteroidales bacterium]|nr:methylmalonyl-CoA mutase family protein [Bacteroidales bacterium]